MSTLKLEVADLRMDMDYLKSTNFTSLFEAAETKGVPGSSKMPSITTRDVPMEDVADDVSEAETDEEQDATVYDDLADLEDAMFENARLTSLSDTIMAGSSGVTFEVTLGTDAPTDGAIV